MFFRFLIILRNVCIKHNNKHTVFVIPIHIFKRSSSNRLRFPACFAFSFLRIPWGRGPMGSRAPSGTVEARASGLASSSGRSSASHKVSSEEWESSRPADFYYTLKGFESKTTNKELDTRIPGARATQPRVLIRDWNFYFGLVCAFFLLIEKKETRGFEPSMSPRCSEARRAGPVLLLLLVITVQPGVGYREDSREACPPRCTCSGELVDCSRVRKGQIPETLPEWTVQL